MPIFNKNVFVLVKLIVTINCLLLLSSCWSATNIEDQNYISAIGIDYKEGKFKIYAQVIDFRNVASPGGKMSESQAEPLFIGIGEGTTLYEAAMSIYETSQSRVEWGHVEALVITEEAIKQTNTTQIIKNIYRFPETRYNSWLYVTKTPIEQIFTTVTLYGESSIRTILFSPTSTFKQKSYVRPILMFKYICQINEPDRTVVVPVIGINEGQWISKDKNIPQLETQGAFIANNEQVGYIFSKEELDGYQWLIKGARSNLVLQEEEIIYGTLVLDTEKYKIKPIINDGTVTFNIEVNLTGGLFDYEKEIPYPEMIELASKLIEEQIRKVYLTALENQIDIYNLMHAFRLKYPKEWSSYTNRGEQFILTESSLQEVKINVYVPFNGKYKRKV